ncbi:MAG: hypothetical protein HFH68_13405 [Lachnospiraceae bacterium]|nr:hypothetical protein [Lachnospiraceae bacterium]
MQEYRKPLFHKGRVLKKEGLEALRDFPSGFAETYMAGWADGILAGFDISYKKGNDGKGQVVASAGAVWHKGNIILSDEEIFPFEEFDRQIIIKLYILPVLNTEDFEIYPLEIRMEMEEENSGGGLELGRFRLSQGARLRKEYQDMQDFHTAYNTLDITNVPYAGPGGITVSPVLLKVFARMVFSSRTSRESDISFALMCLGSQPVPRECLLQYISHRLGTAYREMEHSEIYKCLVQIAGTGNGGSRQTRGKEGPAVF